MLSILRIPLQPQDKRRITTLNMRAANKATPDMVAQLQKDIEDMKALSPAFRARMVAQWGLFNSNFEVYRRAFLEAGLDGGGADQMACLFAGRDTLISDDCADTKDLGREIASVQPMISDIKEDRTEHEGFQCLNHLYSSIYDGYRSGEKETVGQLLSRALEEPRDTALTKSLATIGLKIIMTKGPPGHQAMPDYIAVANSHTGLDKLFSGTRWAGGAWAGAIEYLSGGEYRAVKPMRYGGAPVRGRAIEAEHFPNAEIEGDDDE